MAQIRENRASDRLIREFKENIHELKMYLRNQNGSLIDYNQEFDITRLVNLFYLYDNYNLEFFKQLLELKKRAEEVVLFILSDESAQVVIAASPNFKPMFDTISGKAKSKNENAHVFLKNKEFKKIFVKFISDYETLCVSLNKVHVDFESGSTITTIDSKEVTQNVSTKDLQELIDKAVDLKIKIPHLTKKEEIKYLTRKETADILRISLVTLHEWTKKGIIKSLRLGTRVRYKSTEVEMAFKEIESMKFRRK